MTMPARLKSLLFGGPGTASKVGDVGLLVLRAGIGLIMAFGHGLGKLWSDGGLGPPDRFVSGVEGLGFPAPLLFAWLSVFAEFFAALLIAAGLLTRPAALMLAGNMFVAAFLGHSGDPFFGPPPSKEPAMLFMIPALALMFIGAGRYSLDARLLGGRGPAR
jgi:putative oxidoreductase